MSTTVRLNAREIAALRKTLLEQGYEFRALDYAHYQARGQGVVVSAYKSGKIVIQGAGESTFLQMHGFAGARPGLEVRLVGSDESGKGDYFGPMVVAAVTAGPDEAPELLRAGVKDCKKMADATILRAAAAIRRLCPHAVRTLTPVHYNECHAREKNVALMLARMHAQAIAEAADDRCQRAVIDQFTFAERLQAALEQEGVSLPVEIRPRAEDNLAVAAASVLARAEFLIGLRELGDEHGKELPKGAGAQVERVAREIFRTGGLQELGALAKTHFRTTKRVTEELF